jgi:hypothetical protein
MRHAHHGQSGHRHHDRHRRRLDEHRHRYRQQQRHPRWRQFANVWDISGTNSGSVDGALMFANFQNLTGGSVNDTFTFLRGGSLSGNLKGGAPTNTLDYSQYGSSVTVNLAANTVTGIGGT